MSVALTERSLQIAALRAGFLDHSVSATEVLEDVLARIRAWDDPALWISRTGEGTVRARARELDAAAAADPGILERMPLFGVPFAVKDNIDVAGTPTTAACPAFAYTPSATAPTVARLLDAGAILLGKTNLDQFATGLVGTRSPYGVPRNPHDARFIPGGSSSGSAVAVAAGLVSFALGTDTAGSGRVPAAFNNIVGLKPTRGLLSLRGVVPACRSLDCVSIFAQTTEDAGTVFELLADFDPDDPMSRRSDAKSAVSIGCPFRFGVPPVDELEFFGDTEAARLFAAAITLLEQTGGVRVETRFTPFLAAGRLLYEGPRVAERLHATQNLLSENPGALLPVTRSIIESGKQYNALDAYRADYELSALRQEVASAFQNIDVLLLPTAGTIYKIAEILEEPLRRNTNLGLYTNFVNLLDLAAIAMPGGLTKAGLPFGFSLIAPAFSDHALLDLGKRYQATRNERMGRVT
jgi:allophanate hydrolase